MQLTHFATATIACFVVSQLLPLGGRPSTSGSVPRNFPSTPPVKPALAQTQDTIHHRAADITVTITNSKFYSGIYTASGVSRVCGNAMVAMNGFQDGFNFEFPYSGTYEIRDVNFSSDTLKAGVLTTSYYLDLGLRTKDGGRPPGWVLRTNQPQYGETGTVRLTVSGNIATLRITGQNKQGETLDMSVACKAVVP